MLCVCDIRVRRRDIRFLERISFIIVVSSMGCSGCGSIHVFMKSYDFAITQREHMGKVTSELSTSRFNMPSVMAKSDDFVSVCNKLSWLKMLDLLRVYQRCEELPICS